MWESKLTYMKEGKRFDQPVQVRRYATPAPGLETSIFQVWIDVPGSPGWNPGEGSTCKLNLVLDCNLIRDKRSPLLSGAGVQSHRQLAHGGAT